MDLNNLNGIPSLDEQTIRVCTQEVMSALDKYNCTLVFQEVRHNGQVIDGQFRIVKKPH